jgi:hypothetical protein
MPRACLPACQVVISSFSGKHMQLRVQKWPGMEAVDVLEDPNKQAAAGLEGEEGEGGLWGSVKSLFGSEHKKAHVSHGCCCCGGSENIAMMLLLSVKSAGCV